MTKKFSVKVTKVILSAFVFTLPSLTHAVVWVPIYNDGITIFVPYEPPPGVAVDVQYQYDALGRLVVVKKDGTTKSDYAYDKAGNRIQVVEDGQGAGQTGGSAMTNIPSPPTNPTFYSSQGGSYTMNWDAADGATHYSVRLSNGTTVNTPDDRTTLSTTVASPTWVKACASGGCSDPAYF